MYIYNNKCKHWTKIGYWKWMIWLILNSLKMTMENTNQAAECAICDQFIVARTANMWLSHGRIFAGAYSIGNKRVSKIFLLLADPSINKTLILVCDFLFLDALTALVLVVNFHDIQSKTIEMNADSSCHIESLPKHSGWVQEHRVAARGNAFRMGNLPQERRQCL